MKIVYVNDAMAIWGGLERILVEKMNFLSEQYGYEVHIVTANQGEHPIPYQLSQKVIHHDLAIQFHKQYDIRGLCRLYTRFQLSRLFVKRLRNYIKEISPDIIVSVRTKLTYGIVKAKGPVPLVFESHSSCDAQLVVSPDFFSRMKVAYNNYSVKNAKKVVALTGGDAEDWRKFNPNVCVIPNIVHLNESESVCDCQAKSVIFVGRFSAQKDIRSLLEIWKLVHPVYPDWQLRIFGGYGEKQTSLLPLIREMDANIVVQDPTSDIMKKYMESSILVMTSVFEPFGLVLPEAMSCGLPVVAFDCPYGPADIITDGKDGFLIKDRDIRLFADKLCLLISDPSLRVRMGQQGVISSKRYESYRIMPLWKRLFEDLSQNRLE